MKKFRVYDDRTNETLLESEDYFDCIAYIIDNFDYDEEHKDFPHAFFKHVGIKSFELK